MIRKGLFVSALAASALMGIAPAQASIQLAAVGGIVNQLHNNASLSSNNFAFTICQNGSCQTLFTGVAGVRAYSDLAGLNSWANTGGYASSGGFFDNYRFTFSGASSFFGNRQQTLPPVEDKVPEQTPQQSFFIAPSAPIPEPATWAMMILGFGLVGMAMRRRQAAPSFG